MINAQLTPVETAIDAANAEALKTEVLFPAEVDANGNPVPPEQQLIPWNQRQENIGLIIGEANVNISINSARRRSSDETVAMQLNLFAQFAQVIDPITQAPVLSGANNVSWMRDVMKLAQIDNIDEKMPTVEAMQERARAFQEQQQQNIEQEQAVGQEMQNVEGEAEENERQAEEAGQIDDEMRQTQETGEMDEIINSMVEEGAI